MVEKDSVPFPLTVTESQAQPTTAVSPIHVIAGPVQSDHTPQSSDTTTSSAGDHVSPLPTPQTRTPPSRFRSSSSVNRRSLDASTSLHSFSLSSPTRSPRVLQKSSPMVPSRGRGSERGSTTRGRGGGGGRVCASEGTSPVRDAGVASPRSVLSTQGSSPHTAHKILSPLSLSLSRSPTPCRSRAQSRATSPLRRIHEWSSHLHRRHAVQEEPFVPIDPFKPISLSLPRAFRLRSLFRNKPKDIELGTLHLQPPSVKTPSSSWDELRLTLTDTLPRQLYLHILLRLPAMYFSRVARIFEDAEVSREDLKRMREGAAGTGREGGQRKGVHPPGYPPQVTGVGVGLMAHVGAAAVGAAYDWGLAPAGGGAGSRYDGYAGGGERAGGAGAGGGPTQGEVSPSLIRFKASWESFVDSLLREWKTLNLTSALLASGILTTFQIPEMSLDPLTRTSALLSLICAIMSLSYGCVFIVRFGTMRGMGMAWRWSEEARKDYTSILWNVWVMLSMPAVWLAWSTLLFLVSILSYVWRTGSSSDPTFSDPSDGRLSTVGILPARVAITFILFVGVVYMAMIIRTLRRYGTQDGVRGILGARVGSPVTSPPQFELGLFDVPPIPARRGDREVEREPERGRERTRRERTDSVPLETVSRGRSARSVKSARSGRSGGSGVRREVVRGRSVGRDGAGAGSEKGGI